MLLVDVNAIYRMTHTKSIATFLLINPKSIGQIKRGYSSVVERPPPNQKGPGFKSRPGHCAGWIWVYGSAASFGWDVKPRSGLRAHAFKIMRRPKRTWMTKQKSRGPETYR